VKQWAYISHVEFNIDGKPTDITPYRFISVQTVSSHARGFTIYLFHGFLIELNEKIYK